MFFVKRLGVVLFLFLTQVVAQQTIISTETLNGFIDNKIKQIIQDENNLSNSKNSNTYSGYAQTYINFFKSKILSPLEFFKDYSQYITSSSDNIFMLEKKIDENANRDNHYAVLRDMMKLDQIKLRRSLYYFLDAIVSFNAKKSSENDFYELIDNNYKNSQTVLDSIDISKYKSLDDVLENADVITQAKSELRRLYATLDVYKNIISFLSVNERALFSYKSDILVTFFTNFSNIVNSTSPAKKINKYLDYIYLDSPAVILLIFLLFLVILLKYFFRFIIKKIFLKILDNEKFVQASTRDLSKPFNVFLIIFVIHIILFFTLYPENILFKANRIFLVLYAVIFTFIGFRLVDNFAYVRLKSLEVYKKNLRKEVFNFTVRGIKIAVILTGVFIILNIFGVNTTAVLSGLGIGGIAIGFAAKDTLSNILASISILSSNSVSQGDWIEVGNIQGNVVDIGLRTTTIRTFDNALIYMPNSQIADSSVRNWSKRQVGRRIKMSIGVTYESNFKDIKNAVDDIRKMLLEHPEIATLKTKFSLLGARSSTLVSKEDLRGVKRTLLVFLDEYKESSINILIYCFSRSVVWAEWLEVKQDILFKIAEIFEKNNLEFAYPALSVAFKNKKIHEC